MKKNFDLSLYLVTDSSLVPKGKTLCQVVEEAINGGVTLVQLREKELNTKEFIKTAKELKEICNSKNVPLIINDRIDVALAVDADGVHLGQEDMDIEIAKKLLGPNKIIGITAETLEQAKAAANSGADYIGTLAIYPTKTKKFPDSFKGLGEEGLCSLLDNLSDKDMKVVAIGGLKHHNLPNLINYVNENITKGKNIDGVAIVSAIVAAPDAMNSAKELSNIVKKINKQQLNTTIVKELSSEYSKIKYEILQKAGQALLRIRETSPLIHTITNYVVMNDTANATIAIGGSPCMANGISEVEDFATMAGAVVINIGSLSAEWVDSFTLAGLAAEKAGTPIILDPVAAGATKYRLNTCKNLLDLFKVNVLKGNAGEISSIAGFGGAKSKGVDSNGEVEKPYELVSLLSRQLSTCVAMTGKIDYISDGKRSISIHNGSNMLEKITGSGCTVGNLIASFAAVEKDPIIASVGGIIAMNIASEIAMTYSNIRGPRSFFVALHDELYSLTPEKILKYGKIEINSWE